MMKRILFLISLLLVTGCLLVRAQVYKFDFTSDKKVKEGFIKVTSETLFNDEQGYGYDLQPAWDGKSNQPFFFSVNVPDGNYKVTVTLGSKDSAGNTTVLESVTPEAGVISVGDNSYGHPTEEALLRLTDAGMTVYRTDMQGNILITVD